jgi:carboxymethylenebutenolidase
MSFVVLCPHLAGSFGRVCHDVDATPPIYGPPVTTASGASLVLAPRDGASTAAFAALPATASGTGVLVLPDNRGLSAFYERLALRLAEQGHAAVAVDYFGRTSEVEPGARGADFPFPEHLGRLTRDGLEADLAAGADRLRAGGCRRVISLGFCFGGRLAYLSAAPRFGLAGAIGLYGYPDPVRGAPGPTQLAAGLTAPILAMFGGADPHIPAGTVAAFGEALAAAGVPHEIVTYPGAPHGFFELEQPEHAAASADAWRRTLAFLRGR